MGQHDLPTLPSPIPWLPRRGAIGALKLPVSSGLGGSAAEEPAEATPQSNDPNQPTAGTPEPAESGAPPRRVIRVLIWARRISQSGFLALFLYFLFQTTFRGNFAASADQPVRLPLPVEAFFMADPFVAILTFLSTHSVYRGLAWSLVVLMLTVVFGRVFCGWICPFGTLHHILSWIYPSRYLRSGSRVRSNRTHWWQVGKYYLMAGFLGAAVVGTAIGGVMDPIAVAVRAIGLGFMPILQYVGIRAAEATADTNARFLQQAGDAAHDFFARTVWTASQAYFHQVWLIVILSVAILFLNRLIPRFWCRALCPLGALLGIFSRFSLFGMEKDHAKCTNCNLCLIHCQGGDSPQGGEQHRQAECHMCLNCEGACPENVIKFRFLPQRAGTVTRADLQRRTVLASVAGGVLAVPTLRIGNWPDRAYHEKVIRPPGSVGEREFLERCVRCGECMKVCPNNALHPAFFEAGVEGLWTPLLVPRIGYCETSCVLCGQVCPTGAIQKIDETMRAGGGKTPIRIGTAMFDRGRCLPWAMATPCMVCEEFCPTSPKAIWVEPVSVPKRASRHGPGGQPPAMLTAKVQRPHIDPSLCVGCGACEKVCPVADKPAVYVTSAGETRSPANSILLQTQG